VWLVRLTIYHVPYIHRTAERIATDVMKRTALFWVITQRVVIIPYRRFGTSYRTITQKSAVLIYFAAEAWNHADVMTLNSAENSDYQPTNRPFWDVCPYHSPNTTVEKSKNCPFGFNAEIGLKSIATPDNTGIWWGVSWIRSVPVLSDVFETFFSSIVVLTANGKFLVVPVLHSVSDMTQTTKFSEDVLLTSLQCQM